MGLRTPSGSQPWRTRDQGGCSIDVEAAVTAIDVLWRMGRVGAGVGRTIGRPATRRASARRTALSRRAKGSRRVVLPRSRQRVRLRFIVFFLEPFFFFAFFFAIRHLTEGERETITPARACYTLTCSRKRTATRLLTPASSIVTP